MTHTASAQRSSARDVVDEYFAIIDGKKQQNLLKLFTDDAIVYFPKYGVGHGHQSLGEIGGGMGKLVARIQHDTDQFRIVEDGNRIVVEGTTRGATTDGTEWAPETGPTGRFCSVFDISDGKIAKMSVYLDPDYGNADAGRYPWPADREHGA